MSKKQAADGASEAKKKKSSGGTKKTAAPAQKKTAAKKPTAKKATPAKRTGAAAPKRARKGAEPVDQVEMDLDQSTRDVRTSRAARLDETGLVAADDRDDVIDADIIAETPADELPVRAGDPELEARDIPTADEFDIMDDLEGRRGGRGGTPIADDVDGDDGDDGDDDGDDDDDVDGDADAPVVVEENLTDEERQLRELYGADITKPATAHTEYQDRQTADEDRPMVPEINAREERKQRWEDRRDRRRQRREQRDRERDQRREHRHGAPQQHGHHAGGGGGGARPQHHDAPERASQAPFSAAPPRSAPSGGEASNGQDTLDAIARVGTPLGDAAATVFAQLRNGQPLPVRQLAAMMRKRNLVEVEPDQLAPQLKAELLADERSYRTLGLRPRIVYRGRDLFAPGPVAMSQTSDAEAGVAAALSRLASATHRALGQRIAKASPAGFERLIHAYLVAGGYRDITWVKRVGGISYATATAPGIERMVLISARSGDQPIDRRGIGELRVGVEAKNLVAGILFSARELSEEAERELERAGRSIAVICADQLVATLISAGVAVVTAAAPLHYVDDQLLDELLAG